MEPKRLYSIRWTQTYPEYNILKELTKLKDELIEQCLDHGDLKEANQLIARIKSL
jgi:hypothetical protein